jgi:hypothetical protein
LNIGEWIALVGFGVSIFYLHAICAEIHAERFALTQILELMQKK